MTPRKMNLQHTLELIAGSVGLPSDVPAFAERPEPDWIDKRCILQTARWISKDAKIHQLTDMSPEYRRNVIGYLHDQANGWVCAATGWTLVEGGIGLIPWDEAQRRLDLLAQLPED